MSGKIVKYFLPPPQWQIPVIILMGVMIGMAFFIFRASRAHSYLSDKPETCMNCHIMAPQFSTWNHSSHREVTNCNECHVPHDNLLRKYFFKAKDGMRHATIFTLRAEPQVIFIKEAGIEVVQDNCIRCHEKLLKDSKLEAYTDLTNHFRTERLCWDCHREVPHGRVNSISSVPNARVPVPGSVLPQWMK
ncbi:MAG: cytochrome c nitrite reductase small subunit [Bacteroidales bacterium]|jgi:cytochrome c nitrite reductase small subunit|nr:cytochrome c nitrite reductase small subunit [Bacteroidales bacterium]